MQKMFFLIFDVAFHRIHLRRTDGECAVTLLPREQRLVQFFVNPQRRRTFDLLHHVRQTMRSAQAHQQVYVIFYAADGDGYAAEFVDDAAQVSMQPPAPVFVHVRDAVFRTEYQMIMQAYVR